MPDKSLNLQDFLDATADASKRSRFFIIVLLIVSVLGFVGLLNSVDKGWMLNRIRVVSDTQNSYTKERFGIDPKTDDQRYIQLYGALTRNYVENALTVKVPFFGVGFDINDLGLLSGIGFIAVLTLFRFSIRNEIVSLKLSFKAARTITDGNPEQFKIFYDLLAMKQVFTLPEMEDKHTEWMANELKGGKIKLLKSVPKLICALPIIIYSAVAYYDFATLDIGYSISAFRTVLMIGYTSLFWFLILGLVIWCFAKINKIDRIWDYNWKIVSESRENALALNSENPIAGKSNTAENLQPAEISSK